MHLTDGGGERISDGRGMARHRGGDGRRAGRAARRRDRRAPGPGGRRASPAPADAPPGRTSSSRAARVHARGAGAIPARDIRRGAARMIGAGPWPGRGVSVSGPSRRIEMHRRRSPRPGPPRRAARRILGLRAHRIFPGPGGARRQDLPNRAGWAGLEGGGRPVDRRDGIEGHAFEKSGRRLARKAAVPSANSALPKAMAWAMASSSRN